MMKLDSSWICRVPAVPTRIAPGSLWSKKYIHYFLKKVIDGGFEAIFAGTIGQAPMLMGNTRDPPQNLWRRKHFI